MLNNKTVAVVVPCYNEETQIEQVVNTMPDFVDRIIAVNDKSKDKTLEVLHKLQNEMNSCDPLYAAKMEKASTAFNYANMVVYEMDQKEKKYFTPSEVFNDY